MGYKKEELEEMLKNPQMSSSELEILLEARKNKEINFTLIDIREVFEYTQRSIDGSDMLIPTSMIQNHMNIFEELKESPIVLYCRTGARTGQAMMALRRMGYENVVHLSMGIMSYGGKTSSDAEIPNEL
jgi:rhodanese-related sulfurtransferase